MVEKSVSVVTVFATIFLVSPCFASDTWTRGDIAGEVIWQALHIIDWGHTRHIADNPDQYYEINPVLGKHPDKYKVDVYMAACAVLHPLITGLLPKETRMLGLTFDPRAIWQGLSISLSAGLVAHNFSIGIEVDF
jgi:hypothetical protein